MAEDILKEKPDFRENRYWVGVHFGEFSRKFAQRKFDLAEASWLEKLKSYYDEVIPRLESDYDYVENEAQKRFDETQELLRKLEAIKSNLTHMVGILDKDLIHANTMIKIEYAQELLEILGVEV